RGGRGPAPRPSPPAEPRGARGPGPRRRGWRVSSWPHCTRDAEVVVAERREDDQVALGGVDAGEGADVELVGHEHQGPRRRARGNEGADLAGPLGLLRAVAEERVERRPGRGPPKGQARGLEAATPLAREHAPDRDSLAANAAPTRRAWARPSSERLRWVEHSSRRKPGGSPSERSVAAWRMTMTWPPARRSAHSASSAAAKRGAARASAASARVATRRGTGRLTRRGRSS